MDRVIIMDKYYTYDDITEDMCISMIKLAFMIAGEEFSLITRRIKN